ncbi:hypothetical protein SORBI_3001G257650 [Sorghum bicolor]|uniref:Uncharacterized protein n=1 Tax=Sorghum bicolor TaxID=4558 RepID=A0A1B6QL16_SORBI|nr:hypothetical protein SORBI_3001G257650 [Sorghum bicolor]
MFIRKKVKSISHVYAPGCRSWEHGSGIRPESTEFHRNSSNSAQPETKPNRSKYFGPIQISSPFHSPTTAHEGFSIGSDPKNLLTLPSFPASRRQQLRLLPVTPAPVHRESHGYFPTSELTPCTLLDATRMPWSLLDGRSRVVTASDMSLLPYSSLLQPAHRRCPPCHLRVPRRRCVNPL